MKTLYALYKTEKNGNLKCLESQDYTSKVNFKSELRANGFRVVEVLNETQIQEIKKMSQWDRTSLPEQVIEYVQQCL